MDILEQLRNVIRDMYDTGNNVIRDKPLGRFIKRELPGDRLNLIKDLVYLCLETGWLNKYTQMYLKMPYATYKDIAQEIKYEGGQAPVYSTIQSNIFYCKNKIIKQLGKDIVTDIVVYMEKDIKEYQDRVATLLLKSNKQDILESIHLPFKKEVNYCDSMEDGEFEECLDIVSNYTGAVMSAVAERLSENFAGYVRYISTHTDISNKDRERLKELKEVIGRNPEQVI